MATADQNTGALSGANASRTRAAYLDGEYASMMPDIPAGVSADDDLLTLIYKGVQSAGGGELKVFPFLKESGGAVNPSIVSAASVGDTFITASYHEGSDLGGCTYRVVAAATGTDDGGSYIDAGALQLEAVFGDVVSVSQFGAKADADFDIGDQEWSGTDNTDALAAAIAATPSTRILDFDGGDYMTDSLTVNQSMILRNGRIIADLNTTGFLLTITNACTSGTTDEWGNHISRVNLRDFRLDGNARGADCGGLDLVRPQHFHWQYVECFHFARQGIRCADSARECQFDFLHVRYSGDSDGDYPAVDFHHTETTNGHNNLTFNHFESVFNLGTYFRIGSDDAAGNPTRNIFVDGGLIHGAEQSPVTGPESVTHTDSKLINQTLVELISARGVRFVGVRIHAPGTSPLVHIQDGSSGNPINQLTMVNVDFEGTTSAEGINVDGVVTDLTLIGCSGSGIESLFDIVTETSSSSNNDRVRSIANTWDVGHKFGEWSNVISSSSTPLTLTAGNARQLVRCTGGGDQTVTIPEDPDNEIPIGERYGFLLQGSGKVITFSRENGDVSFETSGSSATMTERFSTATVTKTGDSRWSIGFESAKPPVPSDGDVGFYGTTPIAQQTGVGTDAASIHAALVALGLITA